MDDRYAIIERELAHVKYALQTLSHCREEFPLGAVVGDPEYWRSRLQLIYRTAERYHFHTLRDRTDALLLEVAKIQYWVPPPLAGVVA